jgi:hypothetical protein
MGQDVLQLLVDRGDAVDCNELDLLACILLDAIFLQREGLDNVEDLYQPMQAAFLNKLVESDATQLLVCYELLQLGDIRVQPRNGRQEVCRVEISAETLKLVNDLVHVLEVVNRELRVGLLARDDLLIDAMASSLLRCSPVFPHNMQ